MPISCEHPKMKKPASTKSSGNIFADIGLPDAEVSLLKADLIINIAGLIREKGLTQAQAAKIMGLAQPDVSKLMRGHFAGFSYERIFGFLTALGENVTIRVREAKTKKQARVELELA
jgi:predicted XRE-type DNA-binding protein